MVRNLKVFFYFFVASYFKFFATIQLRKWHPRIVVITGSNGKTTTLHLVESQLKGAAHYSHGANSSFGIPFDILGLQRESYSILEWITLGLKAPIRAWRKPYAEKIYVVEADCDRPGEGAFLGSLLKPEVVVWLSSARTHSMNFEKFSRRFKTIDQAIAHEFAHFARYAREQCIVNGDEPLIMEQITNLRAHIIALKEDEQLRAHKMGLRGSEFAIDGITYTLPYLLPKVTWYSIAASLKLAEYFKIEPSDFHAVSLPPGRSSVFKGIKGTTLIDSTYNANAASVGEILSMVEQIPLNPKWLVLGDLIEQGAQTKEEHEKIAHRIRGFEKIILVGPRMQRFALPLLPGAVGFEGPKEALLYLKENLQGSELILLKGARFLEGVAEHLLADKSDAGKLCRREEIWQKRRHAWGL